MIHRKKSGLITSRWAGGTTTELAIFPIEAEYSKFNFDYRISFATVETEESTFTFMPGVTRHLMILKGSLEIDHLDHYKKRLDRFDTDIFPGEWPTNAKGKVTDFNLMTKGKCIGKLEVIHLEKEKEQKLSLKQNEHLGIYLLSGSIQASIDRKKIIMQEGDFILINEPSFNINVSSKEDSIIISTRVHL